MTRTCNERPLADEVFTQFLQKIMTINNFSHAQVTELLTRAQRMVRYRKDDNGNKVAYGFLLWEDRDWLVVLQWLQDNGLFVTNPKRPPIAKFVKWIEETQVPQLLSSCQTESITLANNALNGARYPWNETRMKPHILVRWRALYQNLDKLWTDISTSEQHGENRFQRVNNTAKIGFNE